MPVSLKTSSCRHEVQTISRSLFRILAISTCLGVLPFGIVVRHLSVLPLNLVKQFYLTSYSYL
nr:MAG TPA: hypothetical protein [Caudoviricetes sp.]